LARTIDVMVPITLLTLSEMLYPDATGWWFDVANWLNNAETVRLCSLAVA
jgi:hypothetical protein